VRLLGLLPHRFGKCSVIRPFAQQQSRKTFAPIECSGEPCLAASRAERSKFSLLSLEEELNMAVSLAELEGLQEDEFEFQPIHEMESEFELNPVRKIYPDALMEHMAHMVMEAESEQQAAEGFLPLIPMVASKLLPVAARALPSVARALPRVANAVSRVTPQLTRGVSNLTRRLFRNPGTRQLVQTVPSIARRTVASIARQAAAGRPVTPRVAQQILTSQARQVLRNPRRRVTTLRRSGAIDRRFHRLTGTPVPTRACPSCGVTRLSRPTCRACGHLLNLTVRF
jgi:hypothetical protein